MHCTERRLSDAVAAAPRHAQAGRWARYQPKLLGTVRRKQPACVQVTYNHHPLYYYKNDKKPGDLLGQDFYNLWYVLSPSGKPNEKPVH